MMSLVATFGTCFALLIASPGVNHESFIIHGYPTIELAEQAKNETISQDAVDRLAQDRYEKSSQYQTHEPVIRSPTPSPYVSVINPTGRVYIPWDARVISEPCPTKE